MTENGGDISSEVANDDEMIVNSTAADGEEHIKTEDVTEKEEIVIDAQSNEEVPAEIVVENDVPQTLPVVTEEEENEDVTPSAVEPVLITQVIEEGEEEDGRLEKEDDRPEEDDGVELDVEYANKEDDSEEVFEEQKLPAVTPSQDDDEEISDYEKRARDIGKLLEKEELWDTDLEDEIEDFDDVHDTTGRSAYRKACEKFGVVPVKYFMHHIEDLDLRMRYHGLGANGTKALAKTLASNFTVEYLDLSGNWMEVEGGQAIARMIEENTFVQTLIIADNKIQSEGVESITRTMQLNSTIRTLDLSGNEIDDTACDWLADMLLNNKYLLELILSRNRIDSDGADKLGDAIASNDILERLDLSWNRIRGDGAVSLCRGLKENIRLKFCNLAWNGLGVEGGAAVADMLKTNDAMLELDISGNRLDAEVAVTIAKAVAGNESLQSLSMGNNLIHTTGLIQLATTLHASENTALTYLSLKDIPVEFEFVKKIESIQARREFTCEYGPEMRAGNTPEDIKKDAINVKSPIILLRENLVINDLRLINSLQKLDQSSNRCVTVEQFQDALDELGLPYKRVHLTELRNKLDRYGDGTIYYGDFVPPDRPQREPDLSQM